MKFPFGEEPPCSRARIHRCLWTFTSGLWIHKPCEGLAIFWNRRSLLSRFWTDVNASKQCPQGCECFRPLAISICIYMDVRNRQWQWKDFRNEYGVEELSKWMSGKLFIPNFIRNKIGNKTWRSDPALSKIKVPCTVRYLATRKMQQCNTDGFGLSQPTIIRVGQQDNIMYWIVYLCNSSLFTCHRYSNLVIAMLLHQMSNWTLLLNFGTRGIHCLRRARSYARRLRHMSKHVARGLHPFP